MTNPSFTCFLYYFPYSRLYPSNSRTYQTLFQRRIDRVSWIQGYTITGAALERVRTKLFAEGGRENVPKVIVVVTDGESTDTEKLMAEAATLKDQF